MKKIINAYIYGIGVGGIIYMLSLLASDVKTQTISNIVSCLIFSGFMGVVSMIYHLEKLSFMIKTSLHFVGISIIVFGMNYYNNWLKMEHFSGFFLNFIVIYLLVWLMIFLLNYHSSRLINQKLAKKKRAKFSK
ncbi:DUF3021 domain-containing protein [Streptococcus iniae]